MSRQLGGRRSPDSWVSPHDRARVRLAERMDEPLEPSESAWLDGHLDVCSACREVDVAYRNDRKGLQAMRVVPPPRDLWARTSAALDLEQARSGGGRRTRPARRQTGSSGLGFPRGRWAPIGALGSIAAVMVVGFLLGNMLILAPAPAGSPRVAQVPSATPNLLPTPIHLPKTDVAWVSRNSDGSIVVQQAAVSDVCPAGDTSGCAPLDGQASNVVTLSVKPKSVHQSPTSGQMVVIGQGSGPLGLSLYVINVGKAAPPSAPPSVAPTLASATPAPTDTSTATPSPTTGAPSPTASASSSPTASVTATPQPSSSPTPKPTATATIVPNVTPAPSAATLIAIASGVGVLNAETAAYSPDGAWFAFTARSLGLTNGSDIYVWHAGDAHATPVTNDRRSVFAGWVGHQLAGSRAEAPTAATTPATSADSVLTTSVAASSTTASAAAAAKLAEYATTSFLIDPATLVRTSIPTPVWRPAIDPTGRFVVYWAGTVTVDPLNGGWRTASGKLVIASWPVIVGTAPAPSGSPTAPPAPPASPSAAPSASDAPGTSPASSSTPQPSPTPGSKATAASARSSASAGASVAPSTPLSPVPSAAAPSAVVAAGLPDDIATASGVDWAVGWDENGTHLAVWIGDHGDRSFGHLDLLVINGAAAQPAVGIEQLSDKPALPGFSLADGHLAWATPPGQDGQGSQLVIYAYSGKDGGINSNQGQPGVDTVIVVQH